jgi:osmotically-inducible protein OsmY
MPNRSCTSLLLVFATLLLTAACAQLLLLPVTAPIDAITTVAEDRPLSDAGTDVRIKVSILDAFAERAIGLLVDASADVYQGQVMLTGSVKKTEDRRKAEELASEVKGVRQIFNEIQVTEEGGIGVAAKDFVIETKLKANLLMARGVTSINYRWHSVNGIVYFLGAARSQGELDKVLALARQTDGVRLVVSHVLVKPP